jgi:hypothetical protein
LVAGTYLQAVEFCFVLLVELYIDGIKDSKERVKYAGIPWGYNWATLFLGDINTGTWHYRLGESRI